MTFRQILLTILLATIAGALSAEVIVRNSPSSNDKAEITISTTEPRAVASESETARQVYESASPAVVHVNARVERTDDLFGQPRAALATGSGFVIDKSGHVVTNAHVVSGASEVNVQFPGGREYDTEIVGVDASSDIAVLRIEASDKVLGELDSVKFADSTKAKVGDFVIAIGNPLALDYTATTGIVSALDRQIQAPNGYVIPGVLQTDASINQGNSGGPLLNSNGDVLGVNSQIATSGTSSGSIGIGFAIPASTVSRIATELIENGRVERAHLGVVGYQVTKPLSEALNLDVDEGVLIVQVGDESPADLAGLRAGDTQVEISGEQLTLGGDIITEIDGERMLEMSDIVSEIEKHEIGDTITVTYYRGAKERTVRARLSERPAGE